MVNWRIQRTLAMATLVAIIGLSFNLGSMFGIASLSEKAFGIVPWNYLIGAGAGYVFWVYYNFMKA